LVALWPHVTIKAKWTRAKAADIQAPFDGQLVSEWRVANRFALAELQDWATLARPVNGGSGCERISRESAK